MDNLENIIESVLFVSGDPVDINEMASLLDVKPKEIHAAAERLKEKYKLSEKTFHENFSWHLKNLY